MALDFAREGLVWILVAVSLLQEWSGLEQAAQGDGVTIPGGVREMCGCGHLGMWFGGHDDVGSITGGLFNQNDSMTL